MEMLRKGGLKLAYFDDGAGCYRGHRAHRCYPGPGG